MSTYLGFDVLDQAIHNRTDARPDELARSFTLLEVPTGARTSDVAAAAPAPLRPFRWTCFSRNAVSALRAFLDGRRGRAVPFWLTSGQQDLTLASDLGAGVTNLSVRWIGYVRHMFPAGGGRRHLALYQPGSAPVFRKVTAASDPGDFTTESLTLESGLAAPLPAATGIVSFLRLCRLEDDDVAIEWLGRTVAESILRVREIPLEAST